MKLKKHSKIMMIDKAFKNLMIDKFLTQEKTLISKKVFYQYGMNLYCNKWLKFTNNRNIKVKREIDEMSVALKSLKLLIKKN